MKAYNTSLSIPFCRRLLMCTYIVQKYFRKNGLVESPQQKLELLGSFSWYAPVVVVVVVFIVAFVVVIVDFVVVITVVLFVVVNWLLIQFVRVWSPYLNNFCSFLGRKEVFVFLVGIKGNFSYIKERNEYLFPLEKTEWNSGVVDVFNRKRCSIFYRIRIFIFIFIARVNFF